MIKENIKQEFIRDKVNLQYNVHRHLDRMSSMIADEHMNEARYNWAIDHLKMMLEPYADDDYKKEVDNIEKEYKPKIESAKTTVNEEDLIKEQNKKILQQLHELIKRLRLGLEFEGSEDIG